GVSRSAALVMAWVMKEKRVRLGQAYAFVKRKSPAVGPNVGLMGQLVEVERTVFGE
ncbi:hypothetical protein HK104_002692, partial [Borealophlyctis nickersoniae]